MLQRLLLGFVCLLTLPAVPALSQQFQGRNVSAIHVRNVTPDDEARLLELLPLKPHQPYSGDLVQQSIETLYRTGRFHDVQADVEEQGAAVAVTFLTDVNYFISVIAVEGVPQPPNQAQLTSATKLELGRLWTAAKEQVAIDGIRRLLDDNGLYQATIKTRVDEDPATQRAAVHFQVTPGERAKIGTVKLMGTPGFPEQRIIRQSKLKAGQPMTSRRLQNAVGRIRGFYQKKQHLEAAVGISEKRYVPSRNEVELVLSVNAGPEVDIRVAGTKIYSGKKKELIPIYEEGTVDSDLVREGENNIRDFMQRKGRFEAEVSALVQEEPGRKDVVVEYHVVPGPKHKVDTVRISGNKYFGSETIRERMFLAEGSLLSRGRFSRQFLERDVETIQNLYVSNGFHQVKVTSKVEDNYRGKKGNIAVFITVAEGPQTLVGKLTIAGNEKIPADELVSLVASQEGQPYSEFNVLIDRENVLTYYFNRGFRDANLVSEAHNVEGQPDRVAVTYRIAEGTRRFVNQVLWTGLETTQPHIVKDQILLRPAEPLSQVDVLETQRRLYDLGIFQKVDMAVENPDGQAPFKNMLIQFVEARKYTVSIGGGADIARFGGGGQDEFSQPTGSTSFSPRISFDITRLNFRGLDHTLSFKSRVSTLQKRGLLNYTAPRVFGLENSTLLFNLIFDRSFNVLTFASRRMEGSVALEHKRSKSDTLIYRYSYRRVNVERDTAKLSVALLPLFARPVRIGMLGNSFIRDRRDDPVDAHRGMFLTIDDGVSMRQVGSEATFARAVSQYSTYHPFGRNLVLARSTQIGLAEPFGALRRVQVLTPTGGEFRFTRDLPLPERFFAGGGNSHRGFGVNQAGPRDLVTGFPVGGDAVVVNNLELRFPLISPNIGGAVFHDMGNVFDKIGNISFRMRQKDPTDFNYMVHALGFGVRYKTPIGPLRVDLAYSINPPSFFAVKGTRQDVLTGPCSDLPLPEDCRVLRRSGHFQFFFSIGQTF